MDVGRKVCAVILVLLVSFKACYNFIEIIDNYNYMLIVVTVSGGEGCACICVGNNNNEYLERLTHTGPKCLHVLYKYILSKFNAYNMNAHTHTHARTHTCTTDANVPF